jgi:hypothetical protein
MCRRIVGVMEIDGCTIPRPNACPQSIGQIAAELDAC